MDYKEIATRYFKSYPQENKLLIVSDGVVFLSGNQLDANAYASGKRLEITTVRRSDIEKKESVPTKDKTFKVITDEMPNDSWPAKRILEWLSSKGCDAKLNEGKKKLLEKVTETLEKEEEAKKALESAESTNTGTNTKTEE